MGLAPEIKLMTTTMMMNNSPNSKTYV